MDKLLELRARQKEEDRRGSYMEGVAETLEFTGYLSGMNPCCFMYPLIPLMPLVEAYVFTIATGQMIYFMGRV